MAIAPDRSGTRTATPEADGTSTAAAANAAGAEAASATAADTVGHDASAADAAADDGGLHIHVLRVDACHYNLFYSGTKAAFTKAELHDTSLADMFAAEIGRL